MRTFFKITSILMLIGGIATTLLGVGMLTFSSLLITTARGDGAELIIYPILYILAGVAELISGVFGLLSQKRNVLLTGAWICGLCTIAFNIAVILVAMLVLSVAIPWYTWVLSLIVPVLFLIGALTARN